jgi:hypothetical protein
VVTILYIITSVTDQNEPSYAVATFRVKKTASLKMEAAHSSKTVTQTTWHHIPEDNILHRKHHENLKHLYKCFGGCVAPIFMVEEAGRVCCIPDDGDST